MALQVLPVHPDLAGISRLPVLGKTERQTYVLEIGVLLIAGATAALSNALFDFSLRIPGHAIIRTVFPMALGLALVPRRMAGTVMGLGAVGSSMALMLAGLGSIGVGAMTSLTVTGPMLDFTLRRVSRGWRLYLAFALTGLASNVLAFGVRALPKMLGLGGMHQRGLGEWWPQAVVTYALCGVLAGLISALVWFQFRPGRETA